MEAKKEYTPKEKQFLSTLLARAKVERAIGELHATHERLNIEQDSILRDTAQNADDVDICRSNIHQFGALFKEFESKSKRDNELRQKYKDLTKDLVSLSMAIVDESAAQTVATEEKEG